MATITKFEITKANPFMILAPAIVFLFGVLFSGEIFTIRKLLGFSPVYRAEKILDKLVYQIRDTLHEIQL